MPLVILLAATMLGILLTESLGCMVPARPLWSGWITFALGLAGYVSMGRTGVQRALRRWTDGSGYRALVLAVPPLVLFAACGIGLGLLGGWDLVRVALYLGGMVGMSLLARRQAERTPGQALTAVDLLLLCFLWVPVSLKWLPNWNVPVLSLTIGGVSDSHWALGSAQVVPFLSIALGLAAFTVIRPVEGIGFTWDLRQSDVRLAVSLYLGFTLLVGLPLGLATGLARFHAMELGPLLLLGKFAYIYLLTATLEEFFFRGVLQNLIARRFSGPRAAWWGLGIAALLFGAVHTQRNVWYGVLAAIAGAFYGYAYLRSGRLSTAALLHALVDFTWQVWFSG